MSAVKISRTKDIAVIEVSNPPVNAISHAVRQGLATSIAETIDDNSIRAAVLKCAGRTFMAGADVTEFGKPPMPPHLNDLVELIENCPKPFLAAIHGQALGGGLEIALACSHRIATLNARLGLPEVNLGVIPGAGGTQRLPRLIGVANALEMVTGGRPVTARKALNMGLVDALVDDVVTQAVEFAKSLADEDTRHRTPSAPIDPASFDADIFDKLRTKFRAGKPGLLAPQAAIDAVEAATGADVEAGKQKERELFLRLRQDPQSAALRHIFFAERASSKVDGLDLKSARAIESVAVIGAGTMGAGIAQFFATNGHSVILLEISNDAAQAGFERISKNLEQSVKRGKITAQDVISILEKISVTTAYDRLNNVDLVIEAAVESMAIKQNIFAQLDAACRPDAILATNTSYLDINELAKGTAHPKRVVGLHFFSPAHVMRLVEIIRTDHADPRVIATLAAAMKKMGKIAVIAGVCHGFIGNRMYQKYQREAGLLLLETGRPDAVDNALKDFGMAMGPFEVLDLSGIDIGYMMRKSLPAGSVDPIAFQVHDRLVEMGRKGRKSKAGFYRYDTDVVECDDVVQDIVQNIGISAGIASREIEASVIVDRCLSALAAEGEAILAEGIASKPGDIDVVFVNGYGFPRHKGGPFYHSKNK